MAAYTIAAGVASKHATLSTTVVDTVTVTNGVGGAVTINNLTGATTLFVAADTVTPADPTASGDGTYAVPTGKSLVLGPFSRQAPGVNDVIVKVVGNANAYGVYRGGYNLT